MNKVFAIAVFSMLVACSPAEEMPRDSSGRLELTLVEVCSNGVVYYSVPNANGSRSYTAKFTTNGTVELCN